MPKNKSIEQPLLFDPVGDLSTLAKTWPGTRHIRGARKARRKPKNMMTKLENNDPLETPILFDPGNWAIAGSVLARGKELGGEDHMAAIVRCIDEWRLRKLQLLVRDCGLNLALRDVPLPYVLAFYKFACKYVPGFQVVRRLPSKPRGAGRRKGSRFKDLEFIEQVDRRKGSGKRGWLSKACEAIAKSNGPWRGRNRKGLANQYRAAKRRLAIPPERGGELLNFFAWPGLSAAQK